MYLGVVICYNELMKRSAINFLREWKNRSDRKPLIIRGARQVGKTWIMKEFGRTQYKNIAYVNFDKNERMATLFSKDMKIERIISGLEIESDTKITPSETLIIFDEIQECPHALTSLKYFYEEAPEYNIVVAGSLLGVAHHSSTGFPVGKVEFMDLYPLNFGEFLEALGQKQFLDLISKQDFQMLETFKSKFVDLLKQYYFIGGMPEVVQDFVNNKDFKKVRYIQNNILLSYEQDFSKHISGIDSERARRLWQSIPSQLAKENKKFIYGALKTGARATEYELALVWLRDSGLVYKISRITKPGLPIKAYEDLSAFKLYILDVGLLGALSLLDAKTILDDNKIFTEFKGSLTEQFVLQELKANNNIPVYYWTGATSEIDFVVQLDGDIIPIEAKASTNTKAKSLSTYRKEFQPNKSVRTSLNDFKKDNDLYNIPLFAIGEVENILTNL